MASVFSLEIYVDKLRLHDSVVCRFPSLLFKLLDFETVRISQIHADVCERLRPIVHQLKPDARQLDEVKEDDGNFVIHRGKSALFRYTPTGLHHALLAVPLYLLLVDAFSQPAKLVGVATVGLGDLSAKIVASIRAHGDSVPIVHVVTDAYRLRSLMGHELGVVTAKLRLMCVGASLVPHMTDAAMLGTVAVDDSVDLNKSIPVSANWESDTQTTKQAVPTEPKLKDRVKSGPVSKPEPRISILPTGDVGNYDDASAVDVELPSPETGASIDPNIHYPPPMFYNSQAKNKPQPAVIYKAPSSPIDSDDPSEVNVVRGDKLTKAPRQTNTIDTVSRAGKSAPRKPLPHPDEDVKYRELLARILSNKANELLQNSPSKAKETEVQPVATKPSSEQIKDTPLLNALLEELLAWRESRGDLPPSRDNQPKSTEYKLRKSTSLTSLIRQRPVVTQAIAETKHDFIKRMSSPKPVFELTRGNVPKTKGWIRTEPKYTGSEITSLSFGLTNTQKMRIAKTNPKLFAALSESWKEREASELQKAVTSNDGETEVRRKKTNTPLLRSFVLDGKEVMHNRTFVIRTARQQQIRRRKEQMQQRNTGALDTTYEKQRSSLRAPFDTPQSSIERLSTNQQFLSQEESELIRISGSGDDVDSQDGGSNRNNSRGGSNGGLNPQASNRSPQMSQSRHPVVVPRLSLSSSSNTALQAQQRGSTTRASGTAQDFVEDEGEEDDDALTSEWRSEVSAPAQPAGSPEKPPLSSTRNRFIDSGAHRLHRSASFSGRSTPHSLDFSLARDGYAGNNNGGGGNANNNRSVSGHVDRFMEELRDAGVLAATRGGSHDDDGGGSMAGSATPITTPTGTSRGAVAMPRRALIGGGGEGVSRWRGRYPRQLSAANTESVSSYVPTDPDDVSVYSDIDPNNGFDGH